jgi:hypothetical protein
MNSEEGENLSHPGKVRWADMDTATFTSDPFAKAAIAANQTLKEFGMFDQGRKEFLRLFEIAFDATTVEAMIQAHRDVLQITREGLPKPEPPKVPIWKPGGK